MRHKNREVVLNGADTMLLSPITQTRLIFRMRRDAVIALVSVLDLVVEHRPACKTTLPG